MRERLADLGRGLVATVALLLLVVGVPAALSTAVGSPLPDQMPDLAAIAEALTTSGVEDEVIVNTVAVLIWIAWLHVLLALVVELVALVRGRPAFELPAGRGVQQAMGRLVASVALVGTALATSRTAAAAPLPIRIPTAVATVLSSVPPPADATTAPASTATGATYVVQRHDSLWSIAEDHLGDGLRWRELRDLNAGRTMPDGSVLDPASDVIHPGWVLVLPGDASTQRPTTTSTVVVEPGDSLWSIAEATAPAAVGATPTLPELHAHWTEVIGLNRDRLADPNDPSVIFTGQEIVVPVLASTLPPPSTQLSSPAPTTTSEPSLAPPPEPAAADEVATRIDVDDIEDVDDIDTADSVDEIVTTTRLGVAGAALAAAVLAARRLARRRRLLTVPAGFAPAPESDELDDLRNDLAVAADDELLERRDGALRHLAAMLQRQGVDTRPRLVRVACDGIEVLLSRPAVPDGDVWRAEGGGMVWTTTADLRAMPGENAAPALVAIGAPDDGDELYLDLEAMGVVGVSGSQTMAEDLLRSFLTELSASAAATDVLAIDVDGAPGVDVVSWDEVADDLLARAEQATALLTANRWATPFHGRSRGPDDALTPVVVALGSVPDDDRFDELCRRVTSSPGTVSIVLLGEHVLAADIEVTDGWLRVPSLDLACPAQQLDSETAADIGQLLAEPDGQLVLLDDVDPTPRAFADIGEASRREPDVLVRLLGEIDVVGGRRPLQPKQVAVMAYIALHAPVTTERVEDAIWPTLTGTRRKRLANTVSDCRRRLGPSHLPIQADGRYSLGAGVGTDVQQFERLDRLAVQAAPDVAVDRLRQALELVRGPVFTYRSADRASYVWIDTENWLTTWELKVTNAALRLSDAALDLGDTDTAVWAAEKGLLCMPTHTALTEALMRAYWRRGDRGAAESVYESHVAALEELDIDDVAETTIDLRDQIKAGRSA